MSHRLIAAALAATMIAAPALAFVQDGPPPPPRGGMGVGLMRADANKDGVITREEVTASAGEQFARLDADKNGKLSETERAPRGPGGRGGMRERAFDRVDADDDGQVSLDEQRAAALRRFDHVDANKDGKLDQAELAALRDRMMAMGPRGDGPPPPPPPAPAPNAPNGE